VMIRLIVGHQHRRSRYRRIKLIHDVDARQSLNYYNLNGNDSPNNS